MKVCFSQNFFSSIKIFMLNWLKRGFLPTSRHLLRHRVFAHIFQQKDIIYMLGNKFKVCCTHLKHFFNPILYSIIGSYILLLKYLIFKFLNNTFPFYPQSGFPRVRFLSSESTDSDNTRNITDCSAFFFNLRLLVRICT